MNPGVTVAGVDGCAGGWFAIVLRDGALQRATLFPTFRALLEDVHEATVIAVDIPIGLPTTAPRAADAAAKRFLGARRSSVFEVAPRALLACDSYAAARELSAQYARGISAQSYALKKKIFEVDDELGGDDRIREVHPEVSFVAMARALKHPMELGSKKTWSGLSSRLRLLKLAGIDLVDAAIEPSRAGTDDVVDAAAAAWTAHRIASKEADCLPSPPEIGEHGRAIAIWY